MKNANENNWSGIESIIDRKLGLTQKPEYSPDLLKLVGLLDEWKYNIDLINHRQKMFFALNRENIELNNLRKNGNFNAGTVELFN